MINQTQNINPNWNSVRKGNTQFGVNVSILKYLFARNKRSPIRSLMDKPCGEGDFLVSAKVIFPQLEMKGYDLFCKPLPEIAENFKVGDMKYPFKGEGDKKYDIISCISGIMVSDNISEFIAKAKTHLNPDGVLVVTNDNVLSIRNRLHFLLFGETKRFRLYFYENEGNWNLVLLQGLWKILAKQEMEIEKVEYVSIYPEDWVLLPIALLLYPFMFVRHYFAKGGMNLETRHKLFPFWCLMGRHYIVYAKHAEKKKN